MDRAHRVPLPKPKPGDRPPHAIVAALDCADVLRKTRELQRIKLRIMTISIFTDNTAKTALARADLNDVRWQLRNIGLLHPARLCITYGGVQRDFTSPEEARTVIGTITK